ncbi:MAG: 2-dehydropantoate 2-reductase [Solirubrobacterales bacterium]|nr:2-dehydropantoate 2-reductase [Solirubrobacterales bacterium]
MGDEPTGGDARRDQPQRLRPPPLDARGRARPPAHRGGRDLGRAGPRGRAGRRAGAAQRRRLAARARQGALLGGRRPDQPRGGARVRICVVGCGAVGSLFAAHLAQLDEVEAWAYDPDQAHVDAINEGGLRISGVSDLHARVRATADADRIPACDYGVVATKSMHTDAAIAATARAFAGAAVCSVQNGIGNEEALAAHCPRVIRGTTFPAGHVVEPGHVEQDTGGRTWIGPFEPKPASMDEVRALADLLTRGGTETLAMEDARGAQWTKLIFNAATNPIGALTGLPHGVACDQPPVRELITGLVDEGKAVATALGVELDSDPDELVDHAREVAYDHKASMLQDVLAERATEIDFLNGGIARFGEQAGVPTPLNRAVWALVKGLEHRTRGAAPPGNPPRQANEEVAKR